MRGTYDGYAHRLSFREHHPQTFTIPIRSGNARATKDSGTLQRLAHNLDWLSTPKTAANLKIGRERFQRRSQRTITNHGEVAVRVGALHPLHRPNNVFATFLFHQPPYKKDALGSLWRDQRRKHGTVDADIVHPEFSGWKACFDRA